MASSSISPPTAMTGKHPRDADRASVVALLHALTKRVDVLERRLAIEKHRRPIVDEGPSIAARALEEWRVRSAILEEERLRQAIARSKKLQETNPRLWNEIEAARLARNRVQIEKRAGGASVFSAKSRPARRSQPVSGRRSHVRNE